MKQIGFGGARPAPTWLHCDGCGKKHLLCECPKKNMRLLKEDKCPDCGQITNERYRQMKMLNQRRWKQIQNLELLIEALRFELEEKK